MTTRLVIVPPAPWVNANHRDNHYKKAKLTKAWRTAAMEAALADDSWEPAEQVHITIHYRFPDNRRRETSNLQPTSKALVDGIVDAGMCPDDRDENCTGPDNRRWWPNGTPLVCIEVEAVA